MTARDSAYSGNKPSFEPTPAQQARDVSLRRFNRLTIYLPLGAAGCAALVLLGIMLWQVFATTPESQTYRFFSGLADLILILSLFPLLLLCAIGPALFGYLVYAANTKRKLEPAQRRCKLQTALWRLDAVLGTAQSALRDRYLEQAARPLISGHAYLAALKAVVRHVRNALSHSKE